MAARTGVFLFLAGRRPALALLALLAVAGFLPAANVVVPSLEFVTRGSMGGAGLFELQSRGELELQVEGGYKFGGRVAFAYADSFLEQADASDGLAFKSVSVTIGRLLGLPVAATWFVGEMDVLCSGDAFPELFGSAPIASSFRGFIYFPTGVIYDGIHEIKGTGLRMTLSPIVDRLAVSTYLYQDGWFSSGGLFSAGRYSVDVRVLANLETLKIEGFLGATYVPTSVAGWYRGGVLFHAASANVEFLAQVGMPKYDPVADSAFSINLFYLLFEPRLRFGMFSLAPTFFWHPGWYQQALTGELGSFDVNLNLSLGDLAVSMVRGGLEGTVDYRSATGIFAFKASPYVSFVTAGALWTLKADAKLWPFDLADLFEAFVGVKAEL